MKILPPLSLTTGPECVKVSRYIVIFIIFIMNLIDCDFDLGY